MKTLHLILGDGNCGALKVALACAGEKPYYILHYPLPLSCFSLPRSTSKTELQRINREFRKTAPYHRYGPALWDFFHSDLSQFDRVVVWWSNSFYASTRILLPLVCRLYPQCNLYQIQFDDEELHYGEMNYPKDMKPITSEERECYAKQYDELLRPDTHLRIYADEKRLDIISLPEDYYDKKILALRKKETKYVKVRQTMQVKYQLDLHFIRKRVMWLLQEGKIQFNDANWFPTPWAKEYLERDRGLLTIKAI